MIADEITPILEEVTSYVNDSNHECEEATLSSDNNSNASKILQSFLNENCINGAGFLALPWAFRQSGVSAITF